MRPVAASRESTAHHEAGHAVVMYRLWGVADEVTIVPDVEAGLLGAASDPGAADGMCIDFWRARLLSLFAGGHAQREHDPRAGDDGCGRDEEEAAETLALLGWTDQEPTLRAASLDLVRRNWKEIQAVAVELLACGRLDSDEVEIICDVVAGEPGCTPDSLSEYRVARAGFAASRAGESGR